MKSQISQGQAKNEETSKEPIHFLVEDGSWEYIVHSWKGPVHL